MSPTEQFAHIGLWVVSGTVIMLLVDMVWCQFRSLSKATRRRYLPWALAAALVCGAALSLVLTVVYADGRWRVYDLVFQAGGSAVYLYGVKEPMRALGRVGSLLFIRPVWKCLHVLVTLVRLVVRFHVKLVATFYRWTYPLLSKIFPTALQRTPQFMYNIANPRRRRKLNEPK